MKISFDKALTEDKPDNKYNLEWYTEDELLELRSRVTALLPASKLRDMDLEQELVFQHRQAALLQQSVLADTSVPPNQKSQVLNSVNATLQDLVKMQKDYYTFERFKRIETLLIRFLNTLPTEQVEDFITKYERELV